MSKGHDNRRLREFIRASFRRGPVKDGWYSDLARWYDISEIELCGIVIQELDAAIVAPAVARLKEIKP